MGESAISLRHLVGVFLLLHDGARIVVGIDDLSGEGILHRNALAAARGRDDPAQCERLLTLERNLDRHLIGGATDPATLHFEARARILEGAQQQVDRIALFELFRNLLERTVDDALGKILLAALHDDVDEMRHQRALVANIRQRVAFLGSVTT